MKRRRADNYIQLWLPSRILAVSAYIAVYKVIRRGFEKFPTVFYICFDGFKPDVPVEKKNNNLIIKPH